MTLPRLSVEALAAQALLEPSRLVVLVEGLSDRTVLEYMAVEEGLPVDVYVVGDIELIDIRKYKIYGGNKARVASALEAMKDVADSNIIGIVDVDCDEILERKILLKGLYYTKFTCLFSILFTKNIILKLVWMLAQKKVNEDVVENIIRTAKGVFFIRVLRELIDASVGLPALKKYVSKTALYGFDFQAYLTNLSGMLKSSFTSDDLRELVESYNTSNSDPRMHVHLHTAVEIICLFMKEFRLINRSVDPDEVYAEMRLLYVAGGGCDLVGVIRNKAAALI